MTIPVARLPAANTGTETTRFNALKHGILSRYTVLPWEDEAEYEALVEALTAEHAPQGPTEEHLVEELAGILWRKRRLRLAEAAAYQRGLEDTTEPFRDTVKAALAHLDTRPQIEFVTEAIRSTPADTEEQKADLDADEALTTKALKHLNAGKPDAYKKAVAALRDDTREWWEDWLSRDQTDLDEDEDPATPDVEGLRCFLEQQLLPWHARRRRELENRPLIRAQAFGESLDPDKLERLARYEVHLDRKLERTLAMLVKLRELRQGEANSAGDGPGVIP